MGILFVDRRSVARGRSINNRRKLLRRIRAFIKSALPANIANGGLLGGGTNTSPVRVAGSALEEPFFAYAGGERRTVVLPGNDRYNRGDELEVSTEEDEVGHGAGPGEGGEDDFVVNVARDEFLELFFEDCELPNLRLEKETDEVENKLQPAGFMVSGPHSQLSIIRSFKQSMARRWAMMDEDEAERAALLQELRELEGRAPSAEVEARVAEIKRRLEELAAELDLLDNFDKSDLRYRRQEVRPLVTVDAALIMIMDVSSSMGKNEKEIARRWFALLYAFIKRRYKSTDLIFIAHTDEAFELSESDFFSTRINGGTTVSPALQLAAKLIHERYDPAQTNIYISHASDGDNWDADGAAVIEEMTKPRGLLSLVQLFSYIEVGNSAQGWFSSNPNRKMTDSTLWAAYAECQAIQPGDKLTMAIIETKDEVYPAFRRIFRRRG